MVSDMIAHVKPDIVMVGLCAARRDKVLEMARGQRETVLDSQLRTLGVTKEVAAQYIGAGFVTSFGHHGPRNTPGCLYQSQVDYVA
jgi:hypothetical protein